METTSSEISLTRLYTVSEVKQFEFISAELYADLRRFYGLRFVGCKTSYRIVGRNLLDALERHSIDDRVPEMKRASRDELRIEWNSAERK